MPRINHVPSYCHHRATGQAVVTIDGKDFYLGKFNSETSRAEYNRILAEWLAAGRRLPTDPASTTIAEVAAAFRTHAQNYYRDAEGNVSKAAVNCDESLKPVLKLYGKTRAVEFGPLRLKAVRESMIADGRVRSNINRHITRIRGVFKWAVENELIPASVYHGLIAVAGLRRGKCEAQESDPVKPVPVEYVNAILPHVSAQVGAMIQLQLVTGMRPGEVTIIRGMDLDTTGKLWIYRPSKHKTMNHGHDRDIYFGPKAQEIIRPFLKPDLSACLFSPAEAEAARQLARQQSRKTPLSCGNKPGSKRAKTARKVKQRYTVSAYYLAIQRGCNQADQRAKGGVVIGDDERIIPQWHPHQLRHSRATELRKQFGVEATQAVLGHSQLRTTEIYAEKNAEAAKRIMTAVG